MSEGEVRRVKSLGKTVITKIPPPLAGLLPRRVEIALQEAAKEGNLTMIDSITEEARESYPWLFRRIEEVETNGRKKNVIS